MTYRLAIDPTQKEGSQLWLTLQQQHYLRRVLRLQEGDSFVAMDGCGQSWIAQLSEAGAILRSPLSESRELPVPVTLIAALPKGGGFDEIVRSCTELGVTEIIPALSQRTLLKPSRHKLERWRKIAAEAAEQSERQIIPKIAEPTLLAAAIAQLSDSQQDCYICVARGEATHLLAYLQVRPPQSTVIATGPEGGWTEEEVGQAIAAGFQSASLGSRILRAVTAPLAAVSLVAGAIEQATAQPSKL
jgi:16S rRNA (uracil1498-N3)-methyltransferase